MKELSLDHRGYYVTGVVESEFNDGVVEYVTMIPFNLTKEKLTHNAIKRNINDGGLNVKRILYAELKIFDVYGVDYKQFNRKLELECHQCRDAMIGVTI